MRIGIDMGHTLNGEDMGVQAVGLREVDKTREIGSYLLPLLEKEGHTVIDCTIDSAMSIEESHFNRIDKANSNNVDLFISIHLNAYNGDARGVETIVSKDCDRKSIDCAIKVQREVCKLGYVDRGIKKGDLYGVNNINYPGMIVKCGFIDSSGDMALYNPKAIAEAINSGVVACITAN